MLGFLTIYGIVIFWQIFITFLTLLNSVLHNLKHKWLADISTYFLSKIKIFACNPPCFLMLDHIQTPHHVHLISKYANLILSTIFINELYIYAQRPKASNNKQGSKHPLRQNTILWISMNIKIIEQFY